ncbi:MAG: FAD-dependent oxidoreductase [Candidatus Heimdallarchaeota archaeon]|nr:FAD-dependent oxidoreductase [Candidatus Heimdallarchaeota archaeon]
MKDNTCDIAIIGSGLTGMSAAIAVYSKNPDLKIKLFGIPFDSNTAKKGEIENIPGFDKVVGVDLIQKVTEQLGKLNSESAQKVVQEMNDQQDSHKVDLSDSLALLDESSSILSISDNVKTVNQLETGFEVLTDEDTYTAKIIILSTGLPELKNTIKGEENFVHKGVSHCAVCDGALFRGRKAVIIGTGNFIARGALFLRKYCRKITVLCPDAELGCDKRFLKKIEATSNIKTNYNIKLENVEIIGTNVAQGVKFTKEGEEKEISTDVVFIELKDKPDLKYLQNFDLKVDDKGHIHTSENNTTNISGMFAAGTIRGEIDYAPVLIGDGYKTGIYAVEYLEK